MDTTIKGIKCCLVITLIALPSFGAFCYTLWFYALEQLDINFLFSTLSKEKIIINTLKIILDVDAK